MAIDTLDIKIMASQRMDDSDEGGGRMTGVEIPDGAVNQVFPSIDHIAATTGKVNLRKVFPAVMSHNKDVYYGAHVVLTSPPTDEKVVCVMFSTEDPADTRKDAADRVESYVIKGPKYVGYLWGPHPQGVRIINIIQPVEQPAPNYGSVLYIEQYDKDDNFLYSQFVKLVDIDDSVKEFVIIGENEQVITVRRRVVTAELSSPLEYDFYGGEVVETTFDSNCTSILYNTVAADRTNFFGVSKLAKDAASGDLSVTVDSIFKQIIPTNKTESIIPDANLAGEIAASFDNLGTQTVQFSGAISSGYTINLGRPLKPGSIKITRSSYVWTDDGVGNLVRDSNKEGYVSYTEGKIQFLNVPSLSSYTITVSFIPAITRSWVSYSDSRFVLPETQGYSWVFSLNPLPRAGSVIVDYRSQGQWYRLRDNGNGVLVPDLPGTGAGTVNYASGSVTITTGALPDVGSEVIVYWDVPADIFSEVVDTTNLPTGTEKYDVIYFFKKLNREGIAPNTFSITFTVSGQQKTISDDGHGKLVGDGTGEINYVDGTVQFIPNQLPDPGTTFTFSYNYGTITTETFTNVSLDGNGNIQLPLSSTDIVPGTVTVKYVGSAHVTGIVEGADSLTYGDKWRRYWNGYFTAGSFTDMGYDEETIKTGFKITAVDKADILRVLKDDEQGNLVDPNGNEVPLSNVDYVNGTITFNGDFTAKIHVIKSRYSERNSHEDEDDYFFYFGEKVWYSEAANSTRYQEVQEISAPVTPRLDRNFVVTYYTSIGSTHEEETEALPLYIHCTGSARRRIVNGGLAFVLDGAIYWEYQGSVYRYADDGISLVQCGTVDKTTGEVELQTYKIVSRSTDVVAWTISTIDIHPATGVTFRIPGSVKPGGVTISATLLDGTQVNLVPDANGKISSPYAYGKVDYNTGVVHVEFGEWKSPASDYQNEIWYNPNNVDEVNDAVLKPLAVDVDSLTYNAVIVTDITVDSDLIQLDPTRLPSDGKVPIFREGYIALIHNTKEDVLKSGIQPGDTVNLSRGDLSYIEVRDYENQIVSKAVYTVDLQNGTVTFDSSADLSLYTQPFRVIHTVEDMRLIASVDINGLIKFTVPISHDYTAGDTLVSSVLAMGDLYASVYNFFTQESWTGEWSDSRIGNPTTANYNVVDYPIEVWNDGAIAERWAIVFTSSTQFYCVGETVGVIAYGDINSDFQPINPSTGQPYFLMRAGGFGSGWSAGNCIRFNTTAAHYPVWLLRAILPGANPDVADSFTIYVRGDCN